MKKRIRREALLDERNEVVVRTRLIAMVNTLTDAFFDSPVMRAIDGSALSRESSSRASARLKFYRARQRRNQTQTVSSAADKHMRSIPARQTVSAELGPHRVPMHHVPIAHGGYKVEQGRKMGPEAGTLTLSSLNPYRPCSRPIA